MWGGGGRGSSGAGANRIEVIPFCAIEYEGLHKIILYCSVLLSDHDLLFEELIVGKYSLI